MKTGTKIAIIAGSVIVVGVAVFLVMKNKKKPAITGTTPPKVITIDDILAVLPAADKKVMEPVLEIMTQDELNDTYAIVMYENKGAVPDAKLKNSMDALTKKYGIFT